MSNINIISENILFSKIDEQYLAKIAEQSEQQSFEKGELVYSKGDKADGLYLIIKGELEIFAERGKDKYILSHASAPYLFGEFLLQGNSERSTSAKTLTDTELLFISRENFTIFGQAFPEQSEIVGERITNRLCWNQTSLALRLGPLFEELDENVVRKLINSVELEFIPSNTYLTKQNAPSLELWIVIDGQFQLSKLTKEGKYINLTTLGRGEVIGEVGVSCDAPRSSDVLATRDSTVARLSREAFEAILKEYPIEIHKAFLTSVVSGFRSKNKKPTAETFALVNLSSSLNTDKITSQLIAGLNCNGDTTAISSADIDTAFSKVNAAQSTFEDTINKAVLQWLSEQEIAHQHIVYVADNKLSDWTKRCLRQADHVIFCMDATESYELSEFETLVLSEIKTKPVKTTLALIHPNETVVPKNTANWTELRNINMHHHIKADSQEDFKKVARFLTGNAVGLVLGGGGARGYAHIGVVRAFKELGIPIDLIGGNSMGAVIASQYAMQKDDLTMLKETQALCLKKEKFTLPLVSIFSGKGITESLEYLFGRSHIEDLWLHFFSISCNISRATIMTHDEGKVMSAVLNSNAPPGLFPPQIVNGDLLVDGALLNNVPVDVMAEFNEGGTIIAVDINAREDLLDNTDNTGGMSGWKLLFNKLNPTAIKLKTPSMIEVLGRSSIIGGLAQRKKLMNGVADLYLQPPLNDYSLMAYKEAEDIEMVGYQHAKRELQQWLDNKH